MYFAGRHNRIEVSRGRLVAGASAASRSGVCQTSSYSGSPFQKSNYSSTNEVFNIS